MRKNLPQFQVLTANTLIPLLLLTIWSSGLVLARILYFSTSYYWFLLWNVLLAWIPVIISSILFFIVIEKKRSISLLTLFSALFFWLLFLPNAPYLITDFVHLRPRNGVPIWYDVLLLLSFALLGLFQFELSLIHVREVLRSITNKVKNIWFVPLIIILMSVGIYLGRFLRWNSWEVFTQPWNLLLELYQVFISPMKMVQAGVYIVATTIVLALFHYLLHSVKDILNHS